jgi:hypothetical protein
MPKTGDLEALAWQRGYDEATAGQKELVRDLTAALVAAVKEHITPETCDFTYETWQLIKDALSGVDIDAGELV